MAALNTLVGELLDRGELPREFLPQLEQLRKRLLNSARDLTFNNEIVGEGKSGIVALARFRGVIVAVKKFKAEKLE